jgi:hypothetical protein
MKAYLLLLPLLCLGFFLSAQEVLLFDDTQEATLVYRYGHLNGPYAASLRNVLHSLQPQNPQQATLDVYYRYNLRILEGDQSLKNCLQWELVETTRAPRPYGFAFEDLLPPSGVIYNLELLADDEVVATKCVEQTFGTSLPAYAFDFTMPEGETYYTLRVSDLNFKYDQRHIQAVQQRKRNIDQYLTSKNKLTALHLSLQAFRQLEPLPQQLDSYRQQVRSYEDQLRRITDGVFWTALQLNTPDAYDPEQLKELAAHCQEEIVAWQRWLNELAANLHILYFDQGVAAYEKGNQHAAYEAFSASLRANDCYAPSHYFLAYLDFAAGKVDAAGERITLVLNHYDPDPNTRLDAERLASGIVRFYLDAGQRAVVLKQYPDGVAIYQQALAFSKGIRGFGFGQAEALSRMQEAYTLDFHDRLDQVVYTQNTGQHQLALEQLNTALDFQERFRVNTTFDTRRLASEIVNDLYEEQLAQIRDYRYAQEWDQALSLVARTETLLAEYPDLVSQPEQIAQEKERVLLGKYQGMLTQTEELLRKNQLDAALAQATGSLQFVQAHQLDTEHERTSQWLILRVQQQRYERFVRGGDRARQANDYSNALEQYAQARQLEQQAEGLRPVATLKQNITATALLEAERIHQRVWQQSADDNEQLQQATTQLHALASRFDIRYEARFVRLIEQLDDQQCTNARDLLLPREEAQLAQDQTASDYIAARATLVRMESLLQQYPDCALSDATLRMNERVVAACATYQEQLEAAERAEQQQQFAEAIRQYAAAGISYQDASVQARLAAHPALKLYDYISNHNNYRMTLAGGHYYLDQRQHDRSLELLHLLIDGGLEPRNTERLQLRLGSALAVRHHVEAANWKTTFYGFVPKEERKPYRKMYRSFRKQWKRMV